MTQTQAHGPAASPATRGETPDQGAEHFRAPTSLGEIVSMRLRALRRGDLGSSAVIIATVLIWVIFQSINSEFLADTNLHNLARQISYGGLISLGVVMILLLGEVDLSIGSISGVGAAVLGVLVEHDGWNPYLGILAAIVAGAILGTAQGLVRTKFNVPSFIVTLGGLLLFLGLQLWLLGTNGSIRFPFGGAISNLEGSSVTPAAGYGLAALAVIGLAALTITGRRRRQRAGLAHDPVGLVAVKIVATAVVLFIVVWELNRAIGVPIALIIFLVLAAGFWALITQTRYGHHVLAVGGNAEAARRAGIKVNRIRVSVFAISGAMAAAGGVMSASYVGAASQDLGGDTILLYSIAAAVIGGTSLFGGRGSAWSAVTGWLVIGSIYNGMFLLNLVSDLQYMVIGAVLVAAVVVDSVSRRHRTT
ncbi:ABC transporter permease [Rugosimonospora acidiphila]|uniref:Xylose transport system permease protein XylH n=1 Tax=Rugosimonospora acidiphila TaxID=556531 RepID=A0ABP9RU49_9ACTN